MKCFAVKRWWFELAEANGYLHIGLGLGNERWWQVAVGFVLAVAFGAWAVRARRAEERGRIHRVLASAHEYGYLDSWLLHELDHRLKYEPERPFRLNMRGPRAVETRGTP